MLGNAPVKLYLRVRIEEIELSDDFLIGQGKATKSKARRGSAARTAQHQELLKRCVQHFRPTYTWPERWGQCSDWQLSLVDVRVFYDRWEPKFMDMELPPSNVLWMHYMRKTGGFLASGFLE